MPEGSPGDIARARAFARGQRKRKPARKPYVPPPSRSDAAQRTGARTPRALPRSDAAQRSGARTRPRHVHSRSDAAQRTPTERTPSRRQIRRDVEVSRRLRKGKEGLATSLLRTALRNSPAGIGARGVVRVAPTVGRVLAAGPTGRGTSSGSKRTVGATRIAAVPSATGGLPASVARNIAIATAQDPKRVAISTAKGARDSVTGIPAALVKTATDPKGAIRDIGKDYSRRYGPLLKGNEKAFRERIKKEGAAGELLDAATVGVPVGAAVGRAAGTAARAGRMGKRAQSVASTPRRAMRVSGGVAKPQELSRNLIVAAAQKGQDNVRGRRQARRARAEDAPAVIREAVARGEVTPLRARKLASMQRRDVARNKGHALERMRGEQSRQVHKGATRDLAKLSKDERAAFKYAMQLGLRGDPATASREVAKHRARVVATREAQGTEVLRTDELPGIDRLLARAGQSFTPRLEAAVKTQRKRAERAALGDPGVDATQAQLRRYAQQAEHLGVKRGQNEGNAQYLRRVKRAAAERGLQRPGYFPSEKRAGGVFSPFAVGGTKAVKGPKAYTGELFRTGRESAEPEVFTRGLARNIKRKANWNVVAENFDRHAFEWSKDKSIKELSDDLERRGIDPGSVAFWNPEKYRQARQSFEKQTDGEDLERSGVGEEPVAAGVTEAVDAATADGKKLATRPEDFADSKGWSVVPRAVHDEITADTRPSGPAARSFDVVKGKTSRVMLGSNPAWLQFQVASNALLTGLAGTGPVNAVKAQAWWRGLPDDVKADVEPYIGVGHFNDSIQQTKLGASANNRLVNAYRGLKATPVFQRAGKLNPLDLMFRADQAQNNFFRKAVLYSRVKKDAYERMGQNASAAIRLQDRLVGMLKLGPEEQMRAVLRDSKSLERHAEHVNDFLGDYLTYTAKERRAFGRPVMFYGFLRFSLRFLFYTMPVKHPVMTSIIGNLGRLQTEEVRRLLGGDQLPWALGKFYWSDDGQLKSIDLSRANPFLNTLTELRAPKDLLGLLPPFAIAALDQFYSKSSFKDRPLRVRGESQGRRSEEYDVADRARVYLEQMLDLVAPYRTAEKLTQEGPQGDDSLLVDPRPTKYKRPDIVESIRKDVERRKSEPTWKRLLRELVPLIPERSKDPELARRIRETRGKEKKKVPAVKLGPAEAREREILLREAQQAAAAIDERERKLLLREAQLAAG